MSSIISRVINECAQHESAVAQSIRHGNASRSHPYINSDQGLYHAYTGGRLKSDPDG